MTDELSVSPDDYGWDEKSMTFVHPQQTSFVAGPRPVAGSLDYLEDAQYIDNMTLLAHWPTVVRLTHTWQNVFEMDGRRYMFHYYRQALNVYDITDPRERTLLMEKRYAPNEGEFGAAAVAYNKELEQWIMIQSFEVPRTYGADSNKYENPDNLNRLMSAEGFRGFRVFSLQGPTEWTLLAEVPTGELDISTGIYSGSGGVDAPWYDGGRYMTIAAAPDDSFINMEFATYPYTPAQLIYDVSDPTSPQRVSEWWVPGQKISEVEEYQAWDRRGNRTSWTGARVPMTIPQAIESGGRYGYAVMGALGFYVLDLTDPSSPTVAGHLPLPRSFAGIEGDVVDTSRVLETGIVLINGGPMNEDGYEPFKEVYVVDVSDPSSPRVISTFPRPLPPEDAPYRDFVLRRGKFGPKRFGSPAHPGKARADLTFYSYGNAGVQMFDIQTPRTRRGPATSFPRWSTILTTRAPMWCQRSRSSWNGIDDSSGCSATLECTFSLAAAWANRFSIRSPRPKDECCISRVDSRQRSDSHHGRPARRHAIGLRPGRVGRGGHRSR